MADARQAALETLIRCRRDGAWSGAGIDSAVIKYGLDRRDAALASRLCLGVLQNSRLCDYYIDCFCKTKLEPKLRDILRIGVYQLVFLDRIPARAAVNETVALCKANGYTRAAGLANAVMRKLSDNINALPPVPNEGSAEHLALKYSHPQWLAQYLIDRKGYSFTESFFASNNSVPSLSIQVNTLLAEVSDYVLSLRRADIKTVSNDKLPSCLELESCAAASLPGYEEGLFYVQDRAARLAVEIAEPSPGMKVLDACSSPGGKSFAAAIAMNNQGSILSCDIHEKKLSLVRSGAKRLGIDIITTEAMDARDYRMELDSSFDIVIADVPCSGFGVIAKKPEIREKDWLSIKSLPAIQSAILNNLSRYVKLGGVLLYSTCTVLEEENENVVKDFLDHNSGFSLESFNKFGIDAPTGMHCFWPNIDGTDGFFVARLRRNK